MHLDPFLYLFDNYMWYLRTVNNDDRRSVVVTGTVKAAGACRGGGVGSPVRALYEKLICWPADESNTSCDAITNYGVKPERRGVNCGTCSKPNEIAP